MAIVFAVRGSANYEARYSSGGKVPHAFNPTQITTQAAGLSGAAIDLSSAQVKYLAYGGYSNTPNGRDHSILIRIAPQYTGSPAANRAIWSISSGPGTTCPYLELRHLTTGQLSLIGKNETGATTLNVGFGAWSPTSGVYYDILVTWDGTTTANAAKCYIDASLLGQGTSSNALNASWANTYWRQITLGYGPNITNSVMYVDEFVIWDTIIDGTANVNLVSGAGLLNGASRTSMVDVASFDGQSNSEPGIGNVRSGTSYTVAGTSYTGTYAASCDYPTTTSVRLGTSYASGSLTGSLVVPASTDVRSGVSVDNTTGTLAVQQDNIALEVEDYDPVTVTVEDA